MGHICPSHPLPGRDIYVFPVQLELKKWLILEMEEWYVWLCQKNTFYILLMMYAKILWAFFFYHFIFHKLFYMYCHCSKCANKDPSWYNIPYDLPQLLYVWCQLGQTLVEYLETRSHTPCLYSLRHSWYTEQSHMQYLLCHSERQLRCTIR